MHTLKEITALFGGTVNQSDEHVKISQVASLHHAKTSAITFFVNTKHQQALSHTHASAVIIKPEHAELTNKPKIITDNPYAYFAKVSAHLNPIPERLSGVHPSANIHANAVVSENVSIAENVVIGKGTVLADHVVIGANTVIESDVNIGANTVIDANVTIKFGTRIGERCHFFAGCAIGGDGFGYAEEAGQWVKIPQVGRVRIGDDVDIGANTTVDRGALDDTVIDDGVKIDNLVQVGHNCHIGAHTVIAGCVGIAGSAVIGEHCKIGGAAMVLGHLSIADGVTISSGSMITRSIKKAGTYTALMPFQSHDAWLKTAANIRQMHQFSDRLKALEKLVQEKKKDEK